MQIKIKNSHKKSGFTLVELIVVIVIVLVLSMVLIPTIMKYVKAAKEASAIACAKQFQTAYTASITEFVADGNYDSDTDVNDYAYEAVTNKSGTNPPTSGRSKFVYDTMNAGAAPHEFEAIALYNVKTYQIELMRYKDFDLDEVFEWTPEESWHKYKSYQAGGAWCTEFIKKTNPNAPGIYWNGFPPE